MKGKTRLIAVVAVVAGLVGGLKGFVLGSGATTTTTPGETTTTTGPLGPVVTLDAITLNLAGGRYLRVGLAFQIAHDHKAGGGGHGPKDTDDPTKGYARAVDLVIDRLGGRAFEELVTPEGRQKVRAELTEVLAEAYPHEIEGVYFTQFVMQ